MKFIAKKPHVSSLSSLFKKGSLALVVAIGLSGCGKKSPDEFMLEAQVFVEQGNNAAAVVSLKNAIQQAPRNADYRFQLGSVYLAQNNYESAEKELSRSLELGYAPSKVLPLLANALQRSGANVELSEIDIMNSEMTSDEKLEVGFRKLQSHIQLEQTLQAQQLLEELSSIDSDTVYKGLIKGYEQVLDQNFEAALDIAKAMYERAPANRDVLNFTARLYMINGNPEEAANIYESYIEVAPDDVESKFALASMLVEQRQPARAEKYIDELLSINANNPLLNQLKGVVRAADEDYKGAKLYSEKAISEGRSDPTLRLVAGLASYKLEEFEDAVEHLTFVASLLPDNHPGLRILAASQLQSNMGDDAVDVLSRVNNISSDDASLLSKAGYELMKSGNTEAAKSIIEQAEAVSETATDLTRLGILKLSINDIEGLVDLEKALEKAPESAETRGTLAGAYLRTKRYDKALELAEEWQSEAPEKADPFILKGEVYQRQQKFAEAEQALNKAQELDPDNTAITTARIRLDLRREKFDDALDKAESILAKDPSHLEALASLLALKYKSGQFDEAVTRVKAVLKDNPANDNLRILLARASLSFNQANVALDTLSAIEPNRNAAPAYWPMMGVALLRTNKQNEALAHYKQWSEYYPNQEASAIGQLIILDNDRKYAEGAQIASDFLSRKDNLEIRLMQSYFFVMSGNVEGAKRVLRSVDDEYQALPFIRGVKARIAVAENRGADGVEDAMVAYDASKNSRNLLLLVRILEMAGNSDGSFKVIENHVNAKPNDMQAKMLLAERQIGKDSQAAIATYEKVLAAVPNNFMVLNNIAYLELQEGNLAKAAEYGARAYEIQPDNAATADTYAQILVRQGKMDEAISTYNRIMNKDMKNEEIFLNYLETLFKNGSTVIAERRMKDLPLTKEASKKRLSELKAEYLP